MTEAILSRVSTRTYNKKPPWIREVKYIEGDMANKLKNAECDCVRSITIVAHGGEGDAEFLHLDMVEYYEKQMKKKRFKNVKPLDYLKSQKTEKTAQFMVLLMTTKWCNPNEGVIFRTCNLLGSWGISNDSLIAKLQLAVNRTGIKMKGYTTGTNARTGIFFGIPMTVEPGEYKVKLTDSGAEIVPEKRTSSLDPYGSKGTVPVPAGAENLGPGKMVVR